MKTKKTFNKNITEDNNMASINGISLKAMKSFEGMEGTAWQGNVYVGTKKVAFWSQDGNGGPDTQEDAELGIIDESFMYKLVWLVQTEKEFKKALKKGYKAMMEVTDGFHVANYYYPDVPNCTAEELFMRPIENNIKGKFFKNAKITYHLYKGLEDFCIGGQLRPEDIKKD